MANLLFREATYRILGACFNVYKIRGHGFTEAVYHACLKVEFRHQQIPAVSKPSYELEYRGESIEPAFEPDFVCFGNIILEIKAVESLLPRFRAKTVSYLRATGCDVALLVNFGAHPLLEHERFVHPRHLPPEEPPSLH